MNYKEQVIFQAIEGLRQSGGIAAPEAFETLFARIFDCGYLCAKQEVREQMIGINATDCTY